MPDELVVLLELLLNRGYSIELSRVHHASYQAKVRNAYGAIIGDFEYRHPIDEPHEWAQGLSYAAHFIDPSLYYDRTFELVRYELEQLL